MENQISHKNNLDFMSIFRNITESDETKGTILLNTHYDSFIDLCYYLSDNSIFPKNIGMNNEEADNVIVSYDDNNGNSHTVNLNKGEDFLEKEEGEDDNEQFKPKNTKIRNRTNRS